jgi:hypothetical protein
MRYRKLDANGDYSFGRGLSDFYIDNPEAVAQAVLTRLNLWKETFWRDLDDGLPVRQEILGASAGEANITYINGVIKRRVSETQGVKTLLGYSGTFDPIRRALNFTAKIQTVYSTTPIVVTGSL